MFSVWAKVDTGNNCRRIAREGQEGGAERWRNLRYEPGWVDGGREESGWAASGERRRSRVSAASPPGLSLTAAGRRGRRQSSAAPSRGTAPKSRRRSRGGGAVLPRGSVLSSCAWAYGRNYRTTGAWGALVGDTRSFRPVPVPRKLWMRARCNRASDH